MCTKNKPSSSLSSGQLHNHLLYIYEESDQCTDICGGGIILLTVAVCVLTIWKFYLDPPENKNYISVKILAELCHYNTAATTRAIDSIQVFTYI